MRRSRSRWLSIVAAAALLIALVPASPASGAVTQSSSSAGSGSTPRPPRATTRISAQGINVEAAGFGQDVNGLDFYRSEAPGTDGTKLNESPVAGRHFVDKTALPGVQYYYTVKVASRKAASSKQAPSRFSAQATGQVKAKVLKADSKRSKSKAKARAKSPTPAHRQSHDFAAKSSDMSAAKLRGFSTVISSVTTLSANTVWTSAMSPIYVGADVIVPAGKTLTIQPGVKVYFDTAASGNGAPAYTPANPSPGVDLVVHGTLIANGSNSNKIVMTSINSSVEQAQTGFVPQAGDWGYVFFDGMGASQISYSIVEFGQGVWSEHTSRPYLLYNVLHDTGDDAVYMENAKTDATTPQVKIVGNDIGTDSDSEGIYLYSWNTATEAITLNPIISGNNIVAEYPIDMEIYDDGPGTGGNNTILGSITNNTIQSNSSEAFYFDAYTRGAKTAKIAPTMTGNTVISQDDDGIYAEAYNYDNGAAIIAPVISGGSISAYDYAMYLEAYSEETTDSTLGNALVTPKVTGTPLVGAWEDAVYLYAETYSKGKASTNAEVANNTIESADYDCIYAYSYSQFGPAYASPVLTNVTATSNDGDYIMDAEAYSDSGFCQSSPRWVGGKFTSLDSYGIYAYAESDKNSAEVKPYISGVTGKTWEDTFELYAYGSDNGLGNTGSATVQPTFTGCTLSSVDYDVVDSEAYAGGTGNAVNSPIVTNCSLSAEDDYGFDQDAYSYDGSAIMVPSVTDTDMWTYDAAFYGYAERYAGGSPTLTASAVFSPKISDSDILVKYDDVTNLNAYNYNAGPAHVKPAISGSSLVGAYDYDCLYGEAYKGVDTSGDAEVSPAVSDSLLKCDYDAVDFDAYGPGPKGMAKTNGTFTNVTMDSTWGYGDYLYAYNIYSTGGSAEAKPAFTNCTVSAPDDYAYYIESYAGGDASRSAVTAPVISGGNVPYSGDGTYFYAQTSGNTAAAAVCQPTIKNCPIYAAWDYGVESEAWTNGTGPATDSAYVYNSPISSYYGVDAYAFSNSGKATESSKILGVSSGNKMRVESFDDYGVYTEANSSSNDAVNTSQGKYLGISSYDAAFEAEALAYGGKATNSSYFGYSSADPKWSLDDNAVYLYSYGANGNDSKPTVTNNVISMPYDDGIDVENYSSGESTIVATVTNNSVVQPLYGEGVYLDSTYDDANSATVTGNSVTKPYYCGIYLSGFPQGLVKQNTVALPGYANSDTNPSDISGVYWNSSKNAQVIGNMIKGARYGLSLDSLDGTASVHWNDFGDALGLWNRPFNMKVDTGSSVPYVDATSNWWSTGVSSEVSRSIDVQGDSLGAGHYAKWSSLLVWATPRVAAISASVSGSNEVFKLTFDRPMNTSIKTLGMGKTSPYSTWKVTGSWNSAGTVWTGSYLRSKLPVGSKVYFSGAKDLPGGFMNSASNGVVIK